MKKTYTSPKIVMESFRLTQHLASCSGIAINSSGIACVLSDPDATAGMIKLAMDGCFMEDNVCGYQPSGMDGTDGICYNTSINMAFTS